MSVCVCGGGGGCRGVVATFFIGATNRRGFLGFSTNPMAYKKTRAVPWSVWPWGKRKMRPKLFEELGRRPFIFRELESTGIYFRGAG